MSRRNKKPAVRVPAGPPKAGKPAGKFPFATVVVVALIVVGIVLWRSKPSGNKGGGTSGSGSRFVLENEQKVFATYAGSESCRQCHQQTYDKWRNSHHALAERAVDPKLDRNAFDPAREIKHGTQTSSVRAAGDKLQMITAGLKAKNETFVPDRVIGVDPLQQFLIPAERGRWQTAELTFDPHKKEWFDVFGNEDRQPGEWGHWTGRGMTWNQMCASCHNTRVRKNYEPATDTYSTRMAERSVGCESCHGPMRDHVEWRKQYAGKGGVDPTVKKPTREQVLDTCGTCHSRRGEITGDFKPGDRYFDHFSLTIPDETDVFYPDGQVHDEDYEFTSFLSSKMHGAGVRCMDCHEPHTSKNILPGNLLCLRCHAPPVAPAPKIEEVAHSFHKIGSTGNLCVNCHMPETTYMQRHARRDHGFTIPDPLLTKQFGIPNACNRCHTDKSTDWALENCEKWYGKKMERPTRTRAQWIAQARTNAPNAQASLLRLLTDEKIPLWRAVAVNLLRNDASDPNVVAALSRMAKDTNELVRAMLARALEQPAQQNDAIASGTLQLLLDDPIRSVRVDAAWGLRRLLDTNSLAGQELLHNLTINRDQPLGLMQWGNFLTDRGNNVDALAAYRQAVEWDKGSPPFRHAYAVALSVAGQADEATRQLTEACRLAPRDAQLRFTLGLALSEQGRIDEAMGALEETVKLDPQFGRGWYNLGLAYSMRQRLDDALTALQKAESLDAGNPQAPYAAATILANQGRVTEARAAAKRALRIAPNHAQANELLQTLSAKQN